MGRKGGQQVLLTTNVEKFQENLLSVTEIDQEPPLQIPLLSPPFFAQLNRLTKDKARLDANLLGAMFPVYIITFFLEIRGGVLRAKIIITVR